MFIPDLNAGRDIYVMMKMMTMVIHQLHLPATMKMHQMKTMVIHQLHLSATIRMCQMKTLHWVLQQHQLYLRV